MLVDFHVHSTASDGAESPQSLVAAAADRGIAALALTDHDNCDGLPEFLRQTHSAVPLRIAGIELSIDPGEGFDRFHLLGLGIDGDNATLRTFLQAILRARDERNAEIIANFARIGIEIDPAELKSYAHGDILARPHFARWLTDNGYAYDVRDAFARFLADDSPKATNCYVERWHPRQEDAFAAIHAAGGLCLMAHPRYWRSEWKTIGCDMAAIRAALPAIRERGLDGIEARYGANTRAEDDAFTKMADELRLLKSAGSDFHGSNKPDVKLGIDVSRNFISPLLERLQ